MLVISKDSDVYVPLTDEDFWIVGEWHEVDASVEDEAWRVLVGVLLKELLKTYVSIISTIKKEMRVVRSVCYCFVMTHIITKKGFDRWVWSF